MKTNGLSCPVCCETHFKSITILREALVTVTRKQICCPLCDEQLSGLDKFTIHLFTHKDTQSSVNIITNTQPVEVPEKTTTSQPPYMVPNEVQISPPVVIAQSDFNQKCASLGYASENNINQNVIPQCEVHSIRCDICNISFSDTNILDMHKNLLHTNGFSCHLCHKRFKMQGSLMVHMRVAHYGFGNNSSTTVRLNKEDKLEQQKTNGSQNDNKQWECDVCLKKFTTKYFLKKHKRLHTGEMPYDCGLCGKSFTFQQSYHKHMLYHSEDKPHTCNECGRSFKELSTLHNHQRIHSGERPFACETCGKCFRQRVSYLVHRRIHTGAMPYRCTSCDKRFRYKVSQRTHKCKAEPPGAVVRQFGDLVQRLLQQQTTAVPEIMQLSIQNTSAQEQPVSNEQQYSTINEECLKQLLYDGNEIT